MDIATVIEQKLRNQLNIHHLEIRNDSAQHHGHASSPQTGHSHFSLLVVSADFVGQNRVQRQRKVYQILQAEMAGPIHALALTTQTPQERDQSQ